MLEATSDHWSYHLCTLLGGYLQDTGLGPHPRFGLVLDEAFGV
jgi:hypothetical protein